MTITGTVAGMPLLHFPFHCSCAIPRSEQISINTPVNVIEISKVKFLKESMKSNLIRRGIGGWSLKPKSLCGRNMGIFQNITLSLLLLFTPIKVIMDGWRMPPPLPLGYIKENTKGKLNMANPDCVLKLL